MFIQDTQLIAINQFKWGNINYNKNTKFVILYSEYPYI